MFDFVHKKKRVVQFVLALISLPFAFFGVDYYFRSAGSSSAVATVGGDKITEAEFAETLREQQNRMRQTLGQNFDPAMFDNPEVRYSLLEQLIGQRLLQDEARRNRFRVSDAQLVQFIADIPAFQDAGKFSRTKYEQLLASQNLTPPMFEQRMRQELTLGPLQEPIASANIIAKPNLERYVALLDQQREVALAAINIDAFMKEVKIEDAAVKAFYDANQAAFQIPEEVKIEYVMLTPEALAQQISVDPADVKKQYDSNINLYSKAEERQASHIL